MRNVLFLPPRRPPPPSKGDKTRSWPFPQPPASRHRVHLGCLFDDPLDRRHLPLLERLCANVHAVGIHPARRRLASLRGLFTGEPLSFPYFADRRLSAWVQELARAEPLDLA